MHTDAGGLDPDAHSPTLAQYHLALWRKPLPSGDLLDITVTGAAPFIFYCSNTGQQLASDAGINSYTRWKRMQQIVGKIPDRDNEAFRDANSTIGAYIVFPRHKQSINQIRGRHPAIADRLDVTLECIRLHYAGEDNPIGGVLQQNAAWFSLFKDFRGYVEFFFLQDLVTDDFSEVRFHVPFAGFNASALFGNIDEYLTYRLDAMRFVKARGQRMLEATR
jgi:hypothetical protein